MPQSAGPGGAGMLVMLIPLLMIITGMVLGFRALTDIRLAEGKLGGAMTATLAAGFFPAMVIVIACGGGVVLLAEEMLPRQQARNSGWPFAGGAVGVWLSFLMMRGMWRGATGWVRPAQSKVEAGRSAWTTAAIALTIAGGGLLLFRLTVFTPMAVSRMSLFEWGQRAERLVLLNLAVLLAGLICGVVERRERAAQVCAWISGSLFVIMLLLMA